MSLVSCPHESGRGVEKKHEACPVSVDLRSGRVVDVGNVAASTELPLWQRCSQG